MAQHLPGEIEIALRTFRADVIKYHGFAVARRFAQRHVPVDHRLYTLSPKYLRTSAATWSKHASAVVHGTGARLPLRARGSGLLENELDGVHQRRQTFKRIVLGLDRDQDPVGSGQGVHGQKSLGCAVDEDVPVSSGTGNRLLEHTLPRDGLDELDLDADKVPAGTTLSQGKWVVFLISAKGLLPVKRS